MTDGGERQEDISRAIYAKSSDSDIEEEELERKIATPPSREKSIEIIKSSLEELINSTDHNRAMEIKRNIERFVESNMDSSNLDNVKMLLKRIIDEIDTNMTKSRRDELSGLLSDVATDRINLIEETDEYYIIEVKSGDTLSLLADRYFKDVNKFRLIYEANRDKIGLNFEIYPGMRLKIPKI